MKKYFTQKEDMYAMNLKVVRRCLSRVCFVWQMIAHHLHEFGQKIQKFSSRQYSIFGFSMIISQLQNYI